MRGECGHTDGALWLGGGARGGRAQVVGARLARALDVHGVVLVFITFTRLTHACTHHLLARGTVDWNKHTLDTSFIEPYTTFTSQSILKKTHLYFVLYISLKFWFLNTLDIKPKPKVNTKEKLNFWMPSNPHFILKHAQLQNKMTEIIEGFMQNYRLTTLFYIKR